jgi:hypothetical protein
MLNGPRKIYEIRKANLPDKQCRVCGHVIERTRRVAQEWERIQYCSAVCRRTGSTQQRIAAAS